MINLQKKLVGAIATGAILLNMATPAYAATTIQISGNGQNSTNDANVSMNHTTLVTQNNTAVVTNNVDADARTGNNDANGNNGGEVLVVTGDASTNVSVSNHLNRNSAQVDCCPQGDTEVLIEGNAQNSTNNANLTSLSSNTLFQGNSAYVDNYVDADARTGANDANANNGGNVTIMTGKATANASVNTTANSNWALVGGEDDNGTGNVSLRIIDNAQNSTNNIDLTLDRFTLLDQFNTAVITNNVDVDARTGNNDANGNNGGDVLIGTGDASVDADIFNNVNFNWAAVECDCILEDLLAKVDGNAQDSTNTIDAVLFPSDTLAFQANDALLDNYEDKDAKTGSNDANGNNSGSEGDPTIVTGDASVSDTISNTGNVNSYGEPLLGDLPIWWNWHLGLDSDVSFTFDLEDLLEWLSSH